MKYLLMLMLFSTTSVQSVIYNTPTSQYYVIDTTADPIQILVLEENMNLPVACIADQKYLLSHVDFSNQSDCLIKTLNQAYDLNIQKYADLKDLYTKDELLALKEASLPALLQAVFSISHSYSLSEIYSVYASANKNEFRYEIHYLTYVKIDDEYLPLNYPL